MRETSAPPLPPLYAAQLIDAFEDTDPYGVVPFTLSLEPVLRAPAPPRLRTHDEYRAARAADAVHRFHLQPLSLTLDVGAWIPDRLLDDDTVVVDVHTLVAADRLVR